VGSCVGGIGDGARDIVGEVVEDVEILLGYGSSSKRSIDLEVKRNTPRTKRQKYLNLEC
jgi:hypothetical protein